MSHVITKAPALDALAQLLVNPIPLQMTATGEVRDSDFAWNQFEGTITICSIEPKASNARISWRVSPMMHNCGCKCVGYLAVNGWQANAKKETIQQTWPILENLMVWLTNSGIILMSDWESGATRRSAGIIGVPETAWSPSIWNPTYRWTKEHRIKAATIIVNGEAHVENDMWDIRKANKPSYGKFDNL